MRRIFATVPNRAATASMHHDVGVRTHLGAESWAEVEQGSLVGPDGRRYFRRTTRSKRKDADVLVAAHAPVVLFYWAGDLLDWCDGDDAAREWHAVRSQVISGPAQVQGKSQIDWTAGRWEDVDGKPLLLLTARC